MFPALLARIAMTGRATTMRPFPFLPFRAAPLRVNSPKTATSSAAWCAGVAPTVRSKHSGTQIKRIFRNHPARIRVEERMGVVHSFLPLHPVQYLPVHQPVVLANGWSAPPVDRPNYPFSIKRTKNKPFDAVGFLPVYTKHRYVCYRK